MGVCLNHPDILSVAKCGSCGSPLCENCVIRSDVGDFCSEKCKKQAEKFHEKYPDGVVKKKSTFQEFKAFISRAVWLIVAIILMIGIIAAVWGGSANAPEFLQSINGWFRDITGL